MIRIAFLSVLALSVITISAKGAKLVVVAVNSITYDANDGGVVQPFENGSSPPTATAPVGAKGFVIGIDNSADPQDPATPTSPAGRLLGVQDLTFSGPVIQRRSPTPPVLPPPVQTKQTARLMHGLVDSGFENPYLMQNDSWWWIDDQFPQLSGPDGPDADTKPDWTIALAPVSTGVQGGANPPSLGAMTLTGLYNHTANVPHGVWLLAYVVATGDVSITGILAGGQVGYDLSTGVPVDDKFVPSSAVLRYGTGQIVPEPSALVLALLPLVGLGFVSELTQTPGNHVSRDRKHEVFSGNDGLRRSP